MPETEPVFTTIDAFVNFAYPINKDKELVAWLKNHLEATSVGGAEARTRDNKFLDMQTLFGPDWEIVQHRGDIKREEGAVGASFLAYKKGTVDLVRTLPLLRLSMRMKSKIKAVQDRYLCEVVIRKPWFVLHDMVAHRPLPKTGKQPEFDENLIKRLRRIERFNKARKLVGRKRHEWMVRIDANTNIDHYAEKIGGVAFGTGIRGIIVSPEVERYMFKMEYFKEPTNPQRLGGRLTDHPIVAVYFP